MKILIGYDGSECADAALDDLTQAGLPSNVEARTLLLLKYGYLRHLLRATKFSHTHATQRHRRNLNMNIQRVVVPRRRHSLWQNARETVFRPTFQPGK
jgi:hypothetical protein